MAEYWPNGVRKLSEAEHLELSQKEQLWLASQAASKEPELGVSYNCVKIHPYGGVSTRLDEMGAETPHNCSAPGRGRTQTRKPE